jgi:hypothetical protein
LTLLILEKVNSNGRLLISYKYVSMYVIEFIKNKIEGTPILKLATVKRQKIYRKLSKKNSLKKVEKKIRRKD